MELNRFLEYRKHIDYVVESFGQWIGVCDEEGWPLFEVPPAAVVSAPVDRGAAASVEIQVPVDSSHPLVAEFIGDGLGEERGGRLELRGALTRLLVIEREGARFAYQCTVSVAEGATAPSMLTIRGVDLLEGLSTWPCPSIPLEWEKARFSEWDTDASGVRYSKPRDLARVEFGTAVDGYTLDGPAATVVRTVIQDSLDAVNALCGWSGDPHMVVEFPDRVDESQRLLVRTDDSTVWETIASPAQVAGLTVTVGLWWPGDDPVRVRTSRQPLRFGSEYFKKPIQVARVEVTE